MKTGPTRHGPSTPALCGRWSKQTAFRVVLRTSATGSLTG